MDETLYYYKDGNCYLVAKHELDETEIGNYQQITKEEYEAHLATQLEHHANDTVSVDPITAKRIRISELKRLLKESDYQAIKYAEGWISEQDYFPIKTARQQYRDEINQLEQEIEDEQ